MAGRPVHWYEGMFLRPHHFQAADRHAREALKESEDWSRPFHWGLRLVEVDREGVGNFVVNLRACEARFKDGTRVIVPGDVGVDPVELKAALAASPAGAVTVFLAIPTFQPSRANVEERPTADGPRYWVERVECRDENTGAGDQPIEVRRLRARLLLSGQDTTGYETLPIARVERSTQADALPRIDLDYVPPLLCLDAWPPLWEKVQSLYQQISAKVQQLAEQFASRRISFESQVPGESENLFKLAILNGAMGYFSAVAYVKGLTPLEVYQELCRLLGQLSLFSDARRTPDLPTYDHEDIGGCYRRVIRLIQERLGTLAPRTFEKRYFERMGERLQVAIDDEWLLPQKRLFLGVETTELSDQECQALLVEMELKLGSGDQVENIFFKRVRGLGLKPIVRPPRELPAGSGVIYFEIERDQVYWPMVVKSHTLAIRMNLSHARFLSDQMAALSSKTTNRTSNLQFAVFIIG